MIYPGVYHFLSYIYLKWSV